MAAEIPNLVKRNKIYYFRCRIPSILTNGRAREVKISLKTGNLTSDLFDVILKVTDYSRRVIAETLQNYNKGGANDMNIVSEIRSRIVQYINTSLIEQDIYTCEYGATCNASKAEGRNMMLNLCNSVESALKNREIPQWARDTADDILKGVNIPEQYRNFAEQEFLKGFLYYARVRLNSLDWKSFLTEHSLEEYNHALRPDYSSAQVTVENKKIDILGDLVKAYLDAPYNRKYKGENWKGVDITFYYVSPSLGESSPWNEASKKINPWGSRNKFSNHSVRAFSGKLAYIKRGSRYDIEYFAGNDIATNSASLFYPVPHLWQYKELNIPKNGSACSQSLGKVIEGYCRRAGINGTPWMGCEITNVTKNENEALFPYKGICKFTTATETVKMDEIVGRKIKRTETSFGKHEVEVYWSSITEDWLAFRYGSTIYRCDRRM